MPRHLSPVFLKYCVLRQVPGDVDGCMEFHGASALHEHKCRKKIDTNSPVGLAIFSILAAISQLERDLIADRVKCGLQNARAKGKLIGRKKLRDSDLIRKLLKSGLSFRATSSIAKCSHGSVSAERQAMKKEEAELKKKIEEKAAAEKELKELGMALTDTPAPILSKI